MSFSDRERKKQALANFAIRANREVNIRTGTFTPATVEETMWARDGLVEVKDLASVKECR